jgi:lysophospholipase L1-like esterase
MVRVKTRLTTGLLLLELLVIGLRPMPALSMPMASQPGEQSSLDNQNITYLPLLLNSWQVAPTRIYCMGDSLTDAGVYEVVLIALLGTHWEIINMGSSGETTADMLERFQSDVIEPGDAAYVIIWAGANDIRSFSEEETETNLQAMYSMAHNAGIQVVAVTITPQNDETELNKAKISAINTWMVDSAVDVDYVADAYTAVEDPDNPGNILAMYDSGDHVHLSELGYAIVAATIYRAVVWELEHNEYVHTILPPGSR